MNLLQGSALVLFILTSVCCAEEFATVTKVIDGDTVRLEDGRRVRFIGIDTPEFHARRGHPADKKRAQEAKDELSRLVLGRKVRLESDAESHDAFNRHLYYIWIDKVLINEVLIEKGFAKAYPFEPNVRHKELFASAEARAQEAKLGIWTTP